MCKIFVTPNLIQSRKNDENFRFNNLLNNSLLTIFSSSVSSSFLLRTENCSMETDVEGKNRRKIDRKVSISDSLVTLISDSLKTQTAEFSKTVFSAQRKLQYKFRS